MATKLIGLLRLFLWTVIVVAFCATATYTIDNLSKGVTNLSAPFSWVAERGRSLLGKTTPKDPDAAPEVLNAEEQLNCFTAIIAKDIEGELAVHLGTARREIASAVLRLKARNPSLTICDIMGKAYTFFPRTWDHKKHARFWKDRIWTVIRDGQTSANWLAAQLIAAEMLKSGPDAGCATNYVRAQSNWTTPFSGELEGAKALEATMSLDEGLRVRGFKIKFLCPRP